MNNEFEEGLFYADDEDFVFNIVFDNEISATIFLTMEEVEYAVKKELTNILKRRNQNGKE